ncbi:restriction endonuclease subunit S [Flavobacteriaceae bacterium]|nr:restriction endonuclease subunit S [Flavobacteriaceae bacterium]
MIEWTKEKIIDNFLVTDFVANGSFASLKENVSYLKERDYAILVRTTDNTKGWNGKYVFVSKDSYEFLKKSSLKPNDLIIANVGDPGKAFLCPDLKQPMTLGPNSILVRSLNENKINNKFFYFYTTSKTGQAQIEFICSATAQKKFNKTSYRNIEIPIPPLDQQKKIAAILDAADAYRQKTKALITKYDELTQSLFLDMFGDETGSLTELGKVIKTVGGGTPSKDNEQYWNGSIPWASVKDLKSDRLNKTQDFITQAGVDNSATRVIPNGSLIVATRMAVGRAAICEMDVAINQDLKAIQLIGEINITYLLYLFKSKENYFDSVSSGATVKGIKIEHITKLKVNLPEIDLQNQFAERVQAIEAQKAQAQASLAGAEDLFNSLLQRAFKGELTS